jgi:hypothetical protein
MEVKTEADHDGDYVYLLEPFGGQVLVSGPNNTKHVTFNELTLHKQRWGRLSSASKLMEPLATRYISEENIYHLRQCNLGLNFIKFNS